MTQEQLKEILFKGKRLDNGDWVYGYYAKLPHPITAFLKDYIIVVTFDSINVIGNAEYVLVDPETVGIYNPTETLSSSVTDHTHHEIIDNDVEDKLNEDESDDLDRFTKMIKFIKEYKYETEEEYEAAEFLSVLYTEDLEKTVEFITMFYNTALDIQVYRLFRLIDLSSINKLSRWLIELLKNDEKERKHPLLVGTIEQLLDLYDYIPIMKASTGHKHKWYKREKTETIDDFAMSYDHHNGPMCETCGHDFCKHCVSDENISINEHSCNYNNGLDDGIYVYNSKERGYVLQPFEEEE